MPSNTFETSKKFSPKETSFPFETTGKITKKFQICGKTAHSTTAEFCETCRNPMLQLFQCVIDVHATNRCEQKKDDCQKKKNQSKGVNEFIFHQITQEFGLLRLV